MNSNIGNIASLGATFCWVFSSTFFTIAVNRVGSVVVNRTRLLLATILLALAHLAVQGELLPLHAELYRWGWLGLSGIIGLTLGDACLFQAFAMIGTHMAMLLLSLAPIMSTIIAWIFLKETLSLIQVFAVVITIAGIAMVVLKKSDFNTKLTRRQYIIGILYGIGAALGQALGLIIAKKGLAGDFSGLSATLIRLSVATVVMWLFTLIRGQAKDTVNKLKDRKAILALSGGAVFGPFLGIWCSMLGIKFTYVGIASTLMALPPVFLLPVSHWIFKEKITLRAIIGTIIAMGGITIIFLT